MVGALNRGIPERHDAVADELVDGAAFFRDRGGNLLEIGRDLHQQIVRREGFGVRGKILQVGKEHGEESRLNAQVSGMPDLMSCRTISSGTNEENDFSELRSSEAADSSLAISRILDGRDAGTSNCRLSIACNCCDTFSTGRDSRRGREIDEEQLDHR